MRSVTLVLVYLVHWNFAATVQTKSKVKKRGLENYSFDYGHNGFSGYLPHQFAGLNQHLPQEIQEFEWPVSTTLNLGTNFENQLQLPVKSAAPISVPQAVLPQRVIPSPAPVTTPPPEPQTPPNLPLLNTQPAGTGQLGGGSLGYSNLGNGAYLIGSGSLGFAPQQPPNAAPTTPPPQDLQTNFEPSFGYYQQPQNDNLNIPQLDSQYAAPLNLLNYNNENFQYTGYNNNGFSGGNLLQYVSKS